MKIVLVTMGLLTLVILGVQTHESASLHNVSLTCEDAEALTGRMSLARTGGVHEQSGRFVLAAHLPSAWLGDPDRDQRSGSQDDSFDFLLIHGDRIFFGFSIPGASGRMLW